MVIIPADLECNWWYEDFWWVHLQIIGQLKIVRYTIKRSKTSWSGGRFKTIVRFPLSRFPRTFLIWLDQIVLFSHSYAVLFAMAIEWLLFNHSEWFAVEISMKYQILCSFPCEYRIMMNFPKNIYAKLYWCNILTSIFLYNISKSTSVLETRKNTK